MKIYCSRIFQYFPSVTSSLIMISVINMMIIYNVYAEDNAVNTEIIRTSETEEENDKSVFDLPEIQNSYQKIKENTGDKKAKSPNIAQIAVLNKITAQSKEMSFNLGEAKYFGNIEIKVYKCSQSEDPYLPDHKMLLSITEHKIDEDPAVIFQGWLFSSNLSISTLEHPVYEVFAKKCLY